ncbi:MAG TPA: patatin-like phospholipase family protein [Bacteroidia bacterium]|nr:patatin-like phospholipase family protein [Bacteroidia bacterium]
MNRCFGSLFILFCFLNLAAFGQHRPKIGLALSGGGAKGLGHIGIMQAIDSAGLHIDYVTGTSMGSIMGAMYAVGYSADSILKIAKSLNWDVLFSNRPSLTNVSVDEKPEYGMYAAEIPIVNGKPQISKGVFEAEELWLTLSKYFMPVHNVKDFSKFKRGFSCIGTDLETGDKVVMDHGEIVTALRGSMAIPSIFTPIEYDGKTVVDGGIIRNFPVGDVKDMGADYVIGVNVTQGLSKAADLTSMISILYQISFYRDAADFVEQQKICDNFIQVPLENYSAASFNSADSIIEISRQTGRLWYPVFKALADSLNKYYPEEVTNEPSYQMTDSILINDISIDGISNTGAKSLKARLGFKKNKYYTADKLNESFRRAFGTRNFTKIQYQFETENDSITKMHVIADETSTAVFKGALHFNSFSGGALVANLTMKNNFFPRTRLLAKANLGRDPRFLVKYEKFVGQKDRYGIGGEVSYEVTELPVYEDFHQSSIYRNKEFKSALQLSRYFKNLSISTFFAWQQTKLIPKVSQIFKLNGENLMFSTGIRAYLNSANEQYFATSGWKAEGEFVYYFAQKPDFEFFYNGQVIFNLDDIDINFENYERIWVKSYHYAPLSSKSTLITGQHVGVELDYQQSFMNNFEIGGLTDFLRNQIPFAGLDHSTLNSIEVGVLQAGWQYELTHNLFSTVTANVGVYDFSGIESIYEITAADNFISGYAVTAGYKTGAGPLELSIMYSDQSKRFIGYLNIGFHF